VNWARISSASFDVTIWLYLGAMVLSFAYLAARRDVLWALARVVAIAGAAANLVSIVARGMAADRVPWGNMFEYSTLLAFLVVAGTLVIVEGVAKIKTLTGFSLMFSVLTLAVAAMFFPAEPSPLQPALNSYWIKIHVQAAIWGSSLFALGGIATMAYLVVDRVERGKLEALKSRTPPPIMGGSIDVDDTDARAAAAPADLVADSAEDVQALSARHRLVPSAAGLDRLAYRLIALAFPIWTFAVIAGAIWAQKAWGRYWGWDPKETWSFITWVVFAGYLHARATSGWKGRRAGVIALVGFASLLVTYYAVNLFIVGLHSYAK
jgi:cytochrome c-type biogenesis protein CcsB